MQTGELGSEKGHLFLYCPDKNTPDSTEPKWAHGSSLSAPGLLAWLPLVAAVGVLRDLRGEPQDRHQLELCPQTGGSHDV